MPARWLDDPALKWFLPLPLLAALAPLVWLVFRDVWGRLEDEALARRQALREAGRIDWRPVAVVVLGAVVLTLQEYFGRTSFYLASLQPALARWSASRPDGAEELARWNGLYAQLWWGLTRVGGYLLPLAAWRLLFPRDAVLDFGLRLRGFREHLWIYAACLAVVVPVLLVVRRQPDFGTYYPFYKLAGRSWLDFAAWETVYLLQFLALEIFFRGWWVGATRSLGAASIFAAALPYCMIHYGKPYLEAMGALVAGVVLGSLAVKTRSIWAGFLVHATVAVLMDVLTLERRGALPELLSPRGARSLVFRHWSALPWIAWAGALALLAGEAWRRRAALRARLRALRPQR